MEEKRNKNKKRLRQIDTEIGVLRKEVEIEGNFMLEIEDEREVRKRVRLKVGKEKGEKQEREQGDSDVQREERKKGVLEKFNRLFFEMKNLPLEYVLSQSSKIVLTSEWQLSQIEKEWVEKSREVKRLVDSKMLLEEKNMGVFTEVDVKKRQIEKHTERIKEALKMISSGLMRRAEKKTPLERLAEEHVQERPKEDLQKQYRNLLSLFSLMKSNKSAVRASVPQSKKASATMHSSHAACLEKIKADVGKNATIPDLVKYRQTKKHMQEFQNQGSVSLHKTSKHSTPIIYAEKSEDEPQTREDAADKG